MNTDTSPRHERAFELYASMAKRSYGRVAQELGVSTSSVKAWSREHLWRKRLTEREVEHARQIADRVESGPDPDNVRNLKIVRVAILKIARAIAEGRVKATMGDLDRMVKLEERLLGIHGFDPVTLGRAAAHLIDVERMSIGQLKAELRKVALDFGVIKPEELAEPKTYG